eukprot:6715408-Prymnesium_polylepis.1
MSRILLHLHQSLRNCPALSRTATRVRVPAVSNKCQRQGCVYRATPLRPLSRAIHSHRPHSARASSKCPTDVSTDHSAPEKPSKSLD